MSIQSMTVNSDKPMPQAGLQIQQHTGHGQSLATRFRRCSVYAWTASLLLILSACSSQQPAPVEERSTPVSINEQVRKPAEVDGAGVQVYPLQNPGVRDLLSQARAAEQSGDLERSATLLERALRIQPRDPELLQQMAEIQLERQQFEQALSFASRSFDVGPKVGELCARNWRTVGIAREHLGDLNGASEAQQRASTCAERKPQGF
jgi:Flp pilus assembly protein TadD